MAQMDQLSPRFQYLVPSEAQENQELQEDQPHEVLKSCLKSGPIARNPGLATASMQLFQF